MTKLNIGETTLLNDSYPEYKSILSIKHLIELSKLIEYSFPSCRIRAQVCSGQAAPIVGMRGNSEISNSEEAGAVAIVRGMDIYTSNADIHYKATITFPFLSLFASLPSGAFLTHFTV